MAEAVTAAFGGIAETLDNRIAEAGAAEAARDYVKLYLSLGHIEHPEMGCPIATLGPEIARQGETVRAAFAESGRPGELQRVPESRARFRPP